METEKKQKSRTTKDARLTKKAGQKAEGERVTVGFRVPAELIEQLDAMAARRGLDRSALLFDLVERGFLAASAAEIAERAIEKIEAASTSNDAIMAMLEDVSERLAAVEQALKK